jgi:hypothetical protein
MIEEHAPYLRERLSQRNLLSMSLEDWISVCEKVNAFWAAARQTKNVVIGLPANARMDLPERVRTVASWIFEQRAGNGSSVLQVLNYVFYGGPSDQTSDRLWKAAFTDEWHIPQFGLSCVGELVGWAMPDQFPPRNGRTSKALRAIGFNVKVHSE